MILAIIAALIGVSQFVLLIFWKEQHQYRDHSKQIKRYTVFTAVSFLVSFASLLVWLS